MIHSDDNCLEGFPHPTSQDCSRAIGNFHLERTKPRSSVHHVGAEESNPEKCERVKSPLASNIRKMPDWRR
ncbi:MAG: hypothetical protein CMJ62_07990 [Planctomycetaceae bacterium]|nr:hypothetical protein [Planctomycetaceae bacterium]